MNLFLKIKPELYFLSFLRSLGPRRVWWRLNYELYRRLGIWRRRYRRGKLDDWILPDFESAIARIRKGQGFFQSLQEDSAGGGFRNWFPDQRASLINRADSLLKGEFEYFSLNKCKFPGGLPDWYVNPLTGQRLDPRKHWSSIRFYPGESGDFRSIWELSRFGFVYLLVRAYACTREEKYPAFFWKVAQDWFEKSPPQDGPLWACGQEAALRVMAWTFALYGFASSRETSDDRVRRLLAMIAAHADRIEGTLCYALSQNNNHSLSEAAGLWTVGLILPEHPRAGFWREKGRKILEREVQRQVAGDGSYVMQSMNYHRLMLQVLLWAMRLGEIHGQAFSPQLHEKFGEAVAFLGGFLDPHSGRAPNYGSNDGSLVLPLNECGFDDFRPVVQAGHYFVHGGRLFPPGPWDEDIYWLFGKNPLSSAPAPDTKGDTGHPAQEPEKTVRCLSYPLGGYYILRSAGTWCMTRCCRHRDRPYQADQLHLDLWWKGINITCDPGTYLYYGNPPWDNGLASTSAHNTANVDNLDQMIRKSCFLWLNWSTGKILARASSSQGLLEYWEGGHDGYRRLQAPAGHRRAILLLGHEHWLVLDRLHSASRHSYCLHWLFPDFPNLWDEPAASLVLRTGKGDYRVQAGRISGECSSSLVRAELETTRGWRSPIYAEKEPALSFALAAVDNSCLFWTVLGPSGWNIEAGLGSLEIAAARWTASIVLNHNRPGPLVHTASIRGPVTDKLATG